MKVLIIIGGVILALILCFLFVALFIPAWWREFPVIEHKTGVEVRKWKNLGRKT